jgi:hypothetical protein
MFLYSRFDFLKITYVLLLREFYQNITFLKIPDDMKSISNSDDITILQQMFVACSTLNFNNVTNLGHK